MEDKMVLGSRGCGIESIVTALESCSGAETILTSWRWVAKAMNEPPANIYKISWMLAMPIINNSYSYSDAYREILSGWKERNGPDATVDNLVGIFRECCLRVGIETIQFVTTVETKAVRSIELMIQTDRLCKKIGEIRGWIAHFIDPLPENELKVDSGFYRRLHTQILQDMRFVKEKWKRAKYTCQVLQCHDSVCCLQYDDSKIVAGLYSGLIKIWNRSTLQCVKEIRLSKRFVTCLQFDDKFIITGDSDCRMTVIDAASFKVVNTLKHDNESIWRIHRIHLRFRDNTLVTADNSSVSVWKMSGAKDIKLLKTFRDKSAISARHDFITGVAFDDKYIITAHEKCIKVLDRGSLELVRILRENLPFIWCMGYQNGKLFSGGKEGVIGIWDVESGCLKTFQGYQADIWGIALDGEGIVSSDVEGEIRIYDMSSTLESTNPPSDALLNVLRGHTSYVSALQTDELGMHIVSGSGDGTIRIWNLELAKLLPVLS